MKRAFSQWAMRTVQSAFYAASRRLGASAGRPDESALVLAPRRGGGSETNEVLDLHPARDTSRSMNRAPRWPTATWSTSGWTVTNATAGQQSGRPRCIVGPRHVLAQHTDLQGAAFRRADERGVAGVFDRGCSARGKGDLAGRRRRTAGRRNAGTARYQT